MSAKADSHPQLFLRVLLVYLIIVVLVGVVITTLITPRRAADLKARPEGHLYYPGAVLLYTYDQDEGPRFSIEPSQGAAVEADLAAFASQSMIRAWYDRQLQARGWSPPASGAGSWRRGGAESYTMEFRNPLWPQAGMPPPESTAFVVTYFMQPGPLPLGVSAPVVPSLPGSRNLP